MLVRPLVSGYRREYVRFLGDPNGYEGGVGHVEQALDTWQLKASCRGPQAEIFFPPAHAERKDEKLQREDRAKSICRSCAVRVECLDYAIRIHEPHGIWGGLNEMERKQMSDRRAG
jgi:WhiB family redox-sensing transcriptional regulator